MHGQVQESGGQGFLLWGREVAAFWAGVGLPKLLLERLQLVSSTALLLWLWALGFGGGISRWLAMLLKLEGEAGRGGACL